jgi:hypothetical protein
MKQILAGILFRLQSSDFAGFRKIREKRKSQLKAPTCRIMPSTQRSRWRGGRFVLLQRQDQAEHHHL